MNKKEVIIKKGIHFPDAPNFSEFLKERLSESDLERTTTQEKELINFEEDFWTRQYVLFVGQERLGIYTCGRNPNGDNFRRMYVGRIPDKKGRIFPYQSDYNQDRIVSYNQSNGTDRREGDTELQRHFP